MPIYKQGGKKPDSVKKMKRMTSMRNKNNPGKKRGYASGKFSKSSSTFLGVQGKRRAILKRRLG